MEQLNEPDGFVNIGAINSIVEKSGSGVKRSTILTNEYATLYLTEDQICPNDKTNFKATPLNNGL